MRKVRIPKRSGGMRVIYIPDAEEKARLRTLVGPLQDKVLRMCGQEVQGFVPGRSPVTNALAHVGYTCSLTMDLEDFFDHVTPEKVGRRLSREEAALVFVNGAARQGLPTSPAVANLAAVDLDRAILRWLARHAPGAGYTRYADDITISFDDVALAQAVETAVRDIVRRCGFRVAERKTRLMCAAAGRRIITGVAVDADGCHAPRSARRRLRAARHRLEMMRRDGADEKEIRRQERRVRGLEEWCQMRAPRPLEERRREQSVLEVVDRLATLWRLSRPKATRQLPTKAVPERDLGEGCFVTNDPAYFLGMSAFTVGWTTCMHPGKARRNGLWFWWLLPGTAVAAYLDDQEMTFADVARKRMRARALVHLLRDGRMVHSRVYGAMSDAAHLQARLHAAGIRPARAGDGIVVGNVPRGVHCPYMDSGVAVKARVKTTGKLVYVVRL